MEFELKAVDGRKTATNPYSVWGEDIGEYLNSLEFYTKGRGRMQDLRMVFVRARQSDQSSGALFDQIEEITGLSVSEVERFLASERFRNAGDPLECIVSVDADWPLINETAEGNEAAFLERFEVIAAGARLFQLLQDADAAVSGSSLGQEVSGKGPKRVAAIIDDGIPYLNRRFFDGSAPRIQSLLLQTSGFLRHGALVQTGRVLDAAQIVRHRVEADQAGEQAVYRSVHRNDPLLAQGVPTGVRKTVEQAASHGAYMLDLMAGAPPEAGTGTSENEKALRNVPILAAQLPPQSVDDTSGARLELPILSALRWVLANAARMRAEKLVLNLSFGVSAGSKDGNGLMETAFEHHVVLAARAGIDMHLVLPFGNEFRSRGVQVSKLASQDNKDMLKAASEVVIGRADETSSFVEIRAKDLVDLPADLALSIAGPGGTTSQFVTIPKGESVAITLNKRTVGRIFHVPARTYFGADPRAAFLLVALSPTAEPRRQPFRSSLVSTYPSNLDLAGPGHWTIQLQQPANTETPFEAIFQVQRDDSAFGYHNRGVQTVLDAATAHGRSEMFRDLSGLGEKSEITRAGTNTAYVSRARPCASGRGCIYAVAAARDYARKGDARKVAAPAAYASQGADWSLRENPDAAIAVDALPSNPGVVASGTASGSAMRQTGSSTAAALYSRQLLLEGSMSGEAVTVPNNKQNRLGALVTPLPDDLRKKTRRQAY
ncbi:MAG: hypothetical protein AAF222_00460 [Pseudomonadota bacterium]